MQKSLRYEYKKNKNEQFIEINIPRFINILEGKEITFYNDKIGFRETHFYTINKYKLILKSFKDGYYLSKEIIKYE